MSHLLTYGILQQRLGRCKLLIDEYPGALAAFSFRKLRKGYAGYCINVRRSSDNATQDIGFINGYLDINSLTNFVGENDGYIRVWYDQSGNSYDLSAKGIFYSVNYQPKIIESGNINYVNWKIAAHFNRSVLIDESNKDFDIDSFSIFSVIKIVSISVYGGYFRFVNDLRTGVNSAYGTYDGAYIYDEGTLLSYSKRRLTPYSVPTDQFLDEFIYNSGNNVINYNNASSLTLQSAPSFLSSTEGWKNWLQIGTLNYTSQYNGSNYGENYIQELILYNSDKSTKRENIESNINAFYNIY